MSGQPDGEAQGWKQKYYDALEELETKEKQWGEVEQALRQGLNRLSLAADDSDSGLNRQLERLRADIRKGVSSGALQAQLGPISQSVLRLDEAKKEHKALPTPAQLMAGILSAVHFPHGMGHRARALAKRLSAAKPEECKAMAREFSELIDEALRWATAESEEETAAEGRGGVLGKLFKGRDSEAQGGEQVTVTAPVVNKDGLKLAKGVLAELIRSLVVEEQQRQKLGRKLLATEQEGQLQQLARELVALLREMGEEGLPEDDSLPVHEVLVRLLERLDIPAELSAEVEAVKEMLLDTLPSEKVETVIAAIAELIAEMRSRMQSEKAEIESFLQQLTDRLQEIDSGFRDNVATQQASYRDGRALGDAVQVQVAGIEASVHEAKELAALKSLVQQRVDAIRSHMDEFRSAEEQRLQQAERQVEELTAKLERVQGESEQLRERLQDERNQAMHDPLTGIPNRLAYNDRIAQEYARWKRYRSALTVAVWDVDKFKAVNDTYGHQAGDKVLSIIASTLHKQIRETDFVARFGGEEFVLLLPETSADNAMVVVEHLRKTVAATEFHFRGTRVPITISCGVSEFHSGDTPEQVFERADKALYEAKSGGRNCCRQG